MPFLTANASHARLLALVVPPHLDDASRQAGTTAAGLLALGVGIGIFLTLLFVWLAASFHQPTLRRFRQD